MVALGCSHCGSEALVKSGRSAGGKQRYLCRGCGRRDLLPKNQPNLK
ncbi:MAG: hypothetical protein KY445_08455 [Armatimonadetes bacterium]|nr:hypothetical protein [Armatimonadota bacterium]